MNKLFKEIVERVKDYTKFWYSVEYSGRQIADFYLKNAVIYFQENAIVIEDERGNCGEVLYKEGVDLKESLDLDGHTKFEYRLFSLYRVTPKDRKGEKSRNGKGWYKEPIPYDVVLDVLKDRMTGKENLATGLYYDVPSRRFFTNEDEYDHQYAWDKSTYSSRLPIPIQLRTTEEEQEIFGTMG